MPRKPKKTREQKIAENFFPVKPEDLKYSIEKVYKPSTPLFIEEPGKKIKVVKEKSKKKTSNKKPSKKKSIEFKVPKIKLKKEGYELIITEKPQAALKISSALGKSTKKILNKVPYYEVNRDGEIIIVACAVGHLFTLKQKERGTKTPIFDLLWVPNYIARKKDFTKKYYDALAKLAKGAGKLTVATDYDVEGEVIGLNIIRFVAGQKDAQRMKFSTLTENELNKSYESKLNKIDWGQAIAGETRHYLDWFYGINLSRELMNSLKSIGKFKLMSIGRVQGPTLNLIVKKEEDIQKFKSKPYWQIFATLEEPEIELIHNKDIFDKKGLEKFESLQGKTGLAETKKSQREIPPKPPFNLTNLQTEAYKLYGISPSKTLQLAQSLYLSGFISYPRTSSQKLPPSINYKNILEKLSKKFKAEKFIKKTKPIEGKKSDPAHPSIYPTGEDESISSISSDEKKIYELIVRRFICLFMESAIIDSKRVSVKVEELIFKRNGSEIREKNWLKFYPQKIKEEEIPDIEGEVKISKIRNEEKETQPPKRFSPASIVSELEKRNLGTKATRSNILETLYDREYIKDQSIRATPLGIALINTLEKNSPLIIDEKLTRELEKKMETIQKAKKDLEKKQEEIIEKAKETITKISNQFGNNQEEIGTEISKANEEFNKQRKEENKLNICPKCKKGHLGITYSKKTKRHFVACDAYPECRNTFSLPPNGTIKKTGKVCEECGFPILMRLAKGRRPWQFCFNPECPTNKERLEEYRKNKVN